MKTRANLTASSPVMKHKDEVQVGDAIKRNDGEFHTVCAKDIKRCPLMGVTIFGDSFKLGYERVEVLERSA